jgi:RNA polymerase sigma factor (sigma-70 family)
MSDVTRILSQIEQGDPTAAEKLLPLVYDELRKLAAAKLAHEKPGQTLQATALVHEAYLRLVQPEAGSQAVGDGRNGELLSPTPGPRTPIPTVWNSRGHFFGAAAEAMRRILVEQARRKDRVRHGGDRERIDLQDIVAARVPDADTILAVDEAVARLAEQEPETAEVVKLHFFAGLTLEETADALQMSRATVYRHWAYARASLRLMLREGRGDG